VPYSLVRVPRARLAASRAHVRLWLAAPATAVWTATVPAAQSPWDSARSGEVKVAAAMWAALTEDEHMLVDAVGRSGKIESRSSPGYWVSQAFSPSRPRPGGSTARAPK
jgi:hypothetical protein